MDHLSEKTALSTLSPIRPERLGRLRRRLRLVRYTPGISRPLLELGVIHCARWSIVDALPMRGEERGWRGLHSRYLLFESNYDGALDDYLDSFTEVIPERISEIWSSCVGFEDRVLRAPGVGGRVIPPAPFREFIHSNRLEILDFYRINPDCTARDVRQATTLYDRGYTACPDDHAEEPAYDDIDLLTLGPPAPTTGTKERFREVFDPWKRAVRGDYGVNPLTIAVPVTQTSAELAQPCREALKALEETETHFARLTFVPPDLVDVGQPQPESFEWSYLLFSSDYWGNRNKYVESLREPLAETWQLADEEAPVDSELRFRAWFDRHSLPTAYYLLGYPPRSVDEARNIVRVRGEAYAGYQSGGYSEAVTRYANWFESDG